MVEDTPFLDLTSTAQGRGGGVERGVHPDRPRPCFQVVGEGHQTGREGEPLREVVKR
jgi:hypothetical protein